MNREHREQLINDIKKLKEQRNKDNSITLLLGLFTLTLIAFDFKGLISPHWFWLGLFLQIRWAFILRQRHKKVS